MHEYVSQSACASDRRRCWLEAMRFACTASGGQTWINGGEGATTLQVVAPSQPGRQTLGS
jgi:hypothetical protein